MKETKDLLKFLFGLAMAADKAAADGKFGLEDLGVFMAPMADAPAAFTGIKNMGAEFKNLTPEQAAELNVWIKANFDIAEDKIEAAIETGIQIAVQIAALVLTFKKDTVVVAPAPTA